MDSNLLMECVEDELEPWQWFDDDVQEDGMVQEADTMVMEVNDNTPVTVSVQPTTMDPVVSSAPLPTGASLVPAGMAPGQKLILTQTPAGLGTILLPALNPGEHPAINQPIFLTTEGFPVQTVGSAQSTVSPLRLVLNMQQAAALRPFTLLTGPPDGQFFRPTLVPKSEPDEVSPQPGEVSPQLQSPQVGATSALAQPSTFTTVKIPTATLTSQSGLASGATLTITTTTTDTRPTAAPTDCTPDLTSHTETGPPDGQFFRPTLIPKSEPVEVSLQPGQVSPQLQSPQVGATSALAQPSITLTTIKIPAALTSQSALASGATLTITTTTTDTRPTAAPTDCTPDLTSHTETELGPDHEFKVEDTVDETVVETPGDLHLSSQPIDMESGDLEYLLKADFTKLPFEKQLKIKQDGRPTPSLERMRTPRTGGRCRTFSDENYARTEWLAGSAKLQKLFCWPCLLFDLTTCSPNNPWVTTGYDDLNNFHKAIQKHTKSKNHLSAAVKLQLFGRVKIEDAPAISVQRHNAQVTKNRELVKKLTIAALYLARQEQAFRGPDESASSSKRGNFVALVRAFAEFDTVLAEHLGSSTVFRGMSATIQDDIMESIARVIQDEVDKELSTAPFIAVEVDDISDISCKCQLTVIVRYVNERGAICERFLGFFDASSDRDAEAITTVVMRAIENYSPASKLVCQTYDGASCMSGPGSGAPALVKFHCRNALFIHCYAHELNLVLAQGTGNIQAAKLFFANLDMFHTFFSSSCKRTALLSDVDGSPRAPKGSDTRWNFKGRAVHNVHKGHRSLCVAFDRIMTEPGWDKEAIAQSSALKQKLEDFDFVFLLGVFQAIFGITEPLVQVLQSKTPDIRKSHEQVKGTLDSLKAIRSDERFLRIYEEAGQTVGTPSDRQRKRRRRDWSDFEVKVEKGEDQEDQGPMDSYRRLYYEVVDGVVLHMSQRFADVKNLDFFYVLDHSSFPSFSESNFPNTRLSRLFKTYPFFDQQRLKNELQVIYGDAFFHKPPRELLKLLIKEELTATLPEVLSLLKLMLTIPVTSASAEGSFSCLKRIQTYLRNTRGQEGLDHLAKISMESSVVEELKSSGQLYNRVTECFASMKERSMPLLFK